MSDVLKDFVCVNPFTYLDVQERRQNICCPSWCPVDIRSNTPGGENNLENCEADEDLLQSWNSPAAQKIRESMLDGSYRHCNHKICPSLSYLIKTGNKPGNFLPRKEFEEKFHIRSVDDLKNFKGLPEEILFGFDRACNLKCPSCRVELIPNDGTLSPTQKSKVTLLELIEKEYAGSLKKIMVTGSGDPFYSNLYRDYLVNFDASRYPRLEEIQIITNGMMLTENMWLKLRARPFIKFIEISIDAGTSNTYENITRLGGSWDKLISNLKFLSTVPTIQRMYFSMVVSQNNFREMNTFRELIQDIFSSASFEFSIAFRQIVHWNLSAYTPAQISAMSVFEPKHAQFPEFLTELRKISDQPHVQHNFHHLLG